MDLDWRIATIKFEYIETIIDYSGGRERESRVYHVHTWNCAGEYTNYIGIRTWSKEEVPVGILIDTRTLKLLRTKCCPKALMTDMLEGYG